MQGKCLQIYIPILQETVEGNNKMATIHMYQSSKQKPPGIVYEDEAHMGNFAVGLKPEYKHYQNVYQIIEEKMVLYKYKKTTR